MSPRPAVRCVELVETVTDWMEGALDDEGGLLVEEHLVICPSCVEYVAQLRLAGAVLRDQPHHSPPAGARAALLDAFRRAT